MTQVKSLSQHILDKTKPFAQPGLVRNNISEEDGKGSFGINVDSPGGELRDRGFRMAMYPYEDPEVLDEIESFRKEALAVEREYLELRVLLRDARADLRAHPENEEFKARVRYLMRRLQDLEKRFPWIVTGLPVEIALWAPPHG